MSLHNAQMIFTTHIQLLKAPSEIPYSLRMCDTRVSAFGILCFVPFLIGFAREMKIKHAF